MTTTERRHYRINETMDCEPGVGTVLKIEYAPCPDETAARELELWGDNTERLYNYRQGIIKGASKAAEKGTYNHAQLVRALKGYYLAVAKDYCREFDCTIKVVFPANLRAWMAEKDAEELRREILNWN